MRYSHSSSAMVKEPHHAAALDFKNYVEKATNGKVDVQIYPGSQLRRRGAGVFRTSSRGSFRSRLSRSTTMQCSASMGVFDLPYMFTNL